MRNTPGVLVPLLMLAIVGTLAYEYQVVLPLLAKFTFGGDAGTYATMSALTGIGAVVGGLATAAGGRKPATSLAWTAIVFGSIQMLTSMAPTLAFLLRHHDPARSRLNPLPRPWQRHSAAGGGTRHAGQGDGAGAVAFLGSTRIGGPIVGWIGEQFGARIALGLGGVATLASGILAYRALARIEARAGDGGTPTIPPPKPA